MYTHVEVDESTLTQVMALGAFASKKGRDQLGLG